ncbi:GDSL esterase/lipase EXL3-like [Vicia villosa]|uniref:GDSL esterase/lipase EXL3-like n=1 Tax=Vicia villosa TaxID=3911 RepID=UPI00273A9EF6|nr:GDSL esterase/lipase EXL3-like [Vicia villosa]
MKLPSSHSFLTLISTIILHLIFFFSLCFETNAKVELPENVLIPALFVFGDSIMDTGNNNFKKTITRCDFAPYGKDFPGGVPTGRFSNGKAPSDIVAEELGIKEFLPPYLDPKLNATELATGVCFASGGSGFDHVTSKLLNAIPLSSQLDSFKEYIEKLKVSVGENRTNEILANSVFLVVFGSNDISNTYFLTRLRKIKYPEFSDYADLLVSIASNFTKEIYQLGARRIGIFNVPPLGCVPLQRTVAGGSERKCVEEYNNATVLFNDKLSNEIDSIKTNLSDSRIVYMDVYSRTLDVIVNRQNYGFANEDKGCCGTGKLEVGFLCNRLGSICSNVSEHVFWDSFHPTEIFYKITIPPLLKNYMSQFL